MTPEDFQKPQEKSDRRSTSGVNGCPLIKVLAANEHGMVVESRRSFEVGAAIVLGIHVTIPQSRQSEFVSAETIVVESKRQLSSQGDRVHRVTMLFSDISHHDRDLLVLVSFDETLVAPPVEKSVPKSDAAATPAISLATPKLRHSSSLN